MALYPVQQGVFQGLNTQVLSCPESANYVISGTLQLPTAIQLGSNIGSGVVVTVKHNTTTIYTGNPGDLGFTVNSAVVAGDTISLILSSSVAQDALLNAVKCSFTMYRGGAI